MPFSTKMFDFLIENKMRNNREWYLENKPTYQKYVYKPLAEFVDLLAPTMLSIDNEIIVTPKIGKCISRIYRDTRFSKDKSLYRDVVWVSFSRPKHIFSHPPGFFFELSPDGFRYGCGYYSADSAFMETMRNHILEGSKYAKKALKCFDAQDIFGVEGDMYKRSKCPDQPEKIRNWIDRKNICLICNSTDFNLLFSDNLYEKVAHDFLLIKPIYDFIIKCAADTNK